mmetsp:Transcript_18158/g.41350  ORF Transcript_18158/g.41350 Transcript_18158/m.41350 type:complete len:295 (+) Transcript_18158:900-1784(+)
MTAHGDLAAPGSKIPGADEAIFSRRYDTFAGWIGVEGFPGGGGDPGFVGGRDAPDILSCRRIPQNNRAGLVRGEKAVAGGRPGGGEDVIAMTQTRLFRQAAPRVPEPHRKVPTAACQHLSVGTELHVQYCLRVSRKRVGAPAHRPHAKRRKGEVRQLQRLLCRNAVCTKKNPQVARSVDRNFYANLFHFPVRVFFRDGCIKSVGSDAAVNFVVVFFDLERFPQFSDRGAQIVRRGRGGDIYGVTEIFTGRGTELTNYGRWEIVVVVIVTGRKLTVAKPFRRAKPEVSSPAFSYK